MPICQGAHLELTYKGQSRILQWHGGRVSTAFTFTPPETSEFLSLLSDKIDVRLVEGEGKRGVRVEAAAKRANIPLAGYKLAFALTPQRTMRPNPPSEVTLAERSQWDFVMTWRPPKPADRPATSKGAAGTKLEVTRYAIELSTTGASGTYGPFSEIWQGAGRLASMLTTGEIESQGPVASHHYEQCPVSLSDHN